MKIGVSALLVFIVVGAVLANETNLNLTVDGVTYSNVTFGTVTPLTVKEAADTTPLSCGPAPTTTGLPRSSGLSRCSTDA
jgi:hypothetical protein